MRLKDIFSAENVVADLKSKDRDGVISELLDVVIDRVPMEKDKLLQVLVQREDQSATAMNGMVAVPHGRIPELESFVMGVGRSREGVDFGAEDSYTKIFFLLIAPGADTVNHLKILARIARLCRNEDFKTDLLEAGSAEEIYQRIVEEEEKII
ncbi:MAG: PTS sugar transporter subunit IIA [bacterium]